eukprot:scaffold1299_cov385-Pavlova_lutheri.AAC.6
MERSCVEIYKICFMETRCTISSRNRQSGDDDHHERDGLPLHREPYNSRAPFIKDILTHVEQRCKTRDGQTEPRRILIS